MMRNRTRLALLGLLMAGLAPGLALADTEDGGSGLSRIEHAFSLPIGRPLFNLSTGYYSENQDSTSSSRYITLTPSITLGLGMGFEASLGIPIDGITTTEGIDEFDRRVDLRTTEATAKIRYTANLGTPRVRFGVMALADYTWSDSRRDGGTKDPDAAYDPGLVGLLSFNFGPANVPMRLHSNLGLWASRNDGAVYFRDYPGPIVVPGLDPDNNDVYFGGVAFEAGFPGATVFAELSGEYLADASGFMSASEGYWRFTPGVRFKLSNTISMSAALSADVSTDDEATEFVPDDFYPETELQVGLTLGRVFGQTGYEASKREEKSRKQREQEEMAAAQAAAAAAAASRLSGKPVDESAIRAEMARDSLKVAPSAAPIPVPTTAYPPTTNEMRFMELENRLRFLELNMRMNELEQRMRWMMQPPAYPAYPALPDTSSRLRGQNTAQPKPASTAPAETPATMAATETDPNAALVLAQQQEIERMRRELDRANQPQPVRQSQSTGSSGSDDDSREGAALAAGLVAGAAIAGSGNDQPPPPAPAPTTGAPAAAAGGAAAGAAVAGSGGAGSPSAVSTIPATAGERLPLVTIKSAPDQFLSDAETRAALDQLAADLKARPDVQVLLVVRGAGADAAAALKATEDQAGMVHEYLVLAGCSELQIESIGVGLAEPPADGSAPTARIEVARIR